MADRTLTVTQLSSQIKDCLEGNFPAVAVAGELSNVVRAASGHVYLTLKDDRAQIRGVMWKGKASRLRFDLVDGLEVVAAGAVEVYAPRGQYQLIIDRLQPEGVGPLELAFRQMKERLEAEGLFDPAAKKPLPEIPRRIALVTSPTSAAVRDMIQVITRRWAAAEIVVVPVPVQGETAAPRIAEGVATADRIGADVMIVGRGGGSMEDLWSFNEEPVARAIFAAETPVVSAVGHEVDVTIADLVADRRALTPSEAGELVVPDRLEVLAGLNGAKQRMVGAVAGRLREARSRLDRLAASRAMSRPLDRIHDLSRGLDELHGRLSRAAGGRLERERAGVAKLAASLDALSPLRTLARGYSITTKDGQIVRSAGDVSEGDRLRTRLEDGEVESVVA